MDYKKINNAVMTDTKKQYETIPELRKKIQESIKKQFIVYHEQIIDQPSSNDAQTNYFITENRAFTEAQSWSIGGLKVAVLNFANNHSVGGAPFFAGAQEESLCRCSTLYPCLQDKYEDFYKYHIQLYENNKINHMGNDDLIYTPNVCVFKSEEQNDPIIPKMLPHNKWYNVDIITCAAPELLHNNAMPSDYEDQISSRIKKIINIAKKQNIEALILGAWGCGAFKNPEDIVARVFHEHLKTQNFKVVVFAMGNKNYKNSAFYEEFKDCISPTAHKIINLLRSTGRENIDNVITWMINNNFFRSAASINRHNNFKGGLAKHSLEVYEEAIKLNKEVGLPTNSIIITSLTHDICKSDQFIIDNDGNPKYIKENCKKGHGRRSMFILKRKCNLPLNYDEEMAIWWHMGEYEPNREIFNTEYTIAQNIKLCKLINKADGIAANLK